MGRTKLSHQPTQYNLNTLYSSVLFFTVPERGPSPTTGPALPSAAVPPASSPGVCFLSVAVVRAVAAGVAVALIPHTGATAAAHRGTLYIADAVEAEVTTRWRATAEPVANSRTNWLPERRATARARTRSGLQVQAKWSDAKNMLCLGMEQRAVTGSSVHCQIRLKLSILLCTKLCAFIRPAQTSNLSIDREGRRCRPRELHGEVTAYVAQRREDVVVAVVD